MRRTVVLSATALLAGALFVALPTSPAAAASCTPTGASSDFNDGFEDLATAEPGNGGGRVHVLYGTAAGLTATSPDDTLFTSTHNTTDEYGTTVAAGDFNGDGCDDLAVSDPYQTINGVADAGVVSVFFGSPSGLRGSTLRLTFAGSGGTPHSGDYFGYGLASATSTTTAAPTSSSARRARTPSTCTSAPAPASRPRHTSTARGTTGCPVRSGPALRRARLRLRARDR